MRLTNNKLNKNIIDRLMKPVIEINYEAEYENEIIIKSVYINNVTSIELDLLFYISQIQDQFGNVKGLYYKDACKTLDCCKQSFYNALNGLEEKQYITINYNYKEKKYWDITILDNIFSNKNDDEKGYLNTNRKVFHSDAFRKLKVNEKKLLILLAYKFNSNTGFTFYPERVCEWLGIQSISLAWDYITNISALANLIIVPGKSGDKIKIAADNTNLTSLSKNTERENFLSHRIKYLCTKRNITFSKQDIKDLIILLGQKASAGISKVINVICHVLDTKSKIECSLINYLLTPNSTGSYPELYT